jgi:hypothetical protein
LADALQLKLPGPVPLPFGGAGVNVIHEGESVLYVQVQS